MNIYQDVNKHSKCMYFKKVFWLSFIECMFPLSQNNVICTMHALFYSKCLNINHANLSYIITNNLWKYYFYHYTILNEWMDHNKDAIVCRIIFQCSVIKTYLKTQSIYNGSIYFYYTKDTTQWPKVDYFSESFG